MKGGLVECSEGPKVARVNSWANACGAGDGPLPSKETEWQLLLMLYKQHMKDLHDRNLQCGVQMLFGYIPLDTFRVLGSGAMDRAQGRAGRTGPTHTIPLVWAVSGAMLHLPG